jgi:hypothetical protein
MGGIGSGRHWRSGKKDTTEDFRSIDVRRWQRDGLLRPNQAFGWQWTNRGKKVASINVLTESKRVILNYRHRTPGAEWQDEKYPILLDWSSCHLGGKRPWFLCPAKECGKRVAILYLGGSIFACRHCYQLAYESQREKDYDRAARRANKIRDRLGWEPGFLNGSGLKPKGMHWSTFEKLSAHHDAFVQTSLADISTRFRLLGESVDDLF